jgi:hypothetical protein
MSTDLSREPSAPTGVRSAQPQKRSLSPFRAIATSAGIVLWPLRLSRASYSRRKDAVLVHAADGEHVGVLAEHWSAALRDPLEPFEDPARALDERQTSHSEYLAAGVIRLGIAEGTQDHGGRDRCHVRDRKQRVRGR